MLKFELPNVRAAVSSVQSLGLVTGGALVATLWYMGEKIKPFQKLRRQFQR
jgi:hypothetical protein